MIRLLKSGEDRGSLMIEALAMLTLIAMVTPILYKKAAERTTELQDINAASQMRVMIQGVDDYIKDHYSEIKNGDTITTGCTGHETQAYDTFKNGGDGAVVLDNIAHLCEYLPYGFVDAAGDVRGSNTFSGYQVAVSKRVSAGDPNAASLTGFIVADPKFEIPMIRASRIASMIGSNGGYTLGQVGNGVQGVWKIDDLSTLGLNSTVDGSIMAASIQTITSGGMNSEDVLHRKDTGDPTLNTMETTLYMGGNDIEDVNKLIIDNASGDDDALEIINGGATIEKGISAGGGQFKVDNGGKATMAGAQVNGAANITGNTTIGGNTTITGGLTAANNKFTVQASTGNTNVGGTLTVGGNAQFNKNINVAGDSVVAGNSTVNKDLHVLGNAQIDQNLTVDGDTNLNTLNVAGESNFYGDAYFDQNVDVAGDLNVAGTLKANQFKSKRLQGGLMAHDWASNPNNDRFVFTAEWGDGNINNSKVYMGPNNEVVVGNKAVTMGGEGTQIVMSPTNGSVTIAPGGVSARELVVTKGQTLVDNGKFIVSTGTTSGLNQLETADNRVDMFRNAAGSILSVTNGTTSTDGSVQIRKGVVEISTNYSDYTSLPSGAGYILADRFVDQKRWNSAATPTVADVSSYNPDYDLYQVNPAYTSVMHDIKLTTRGGARLSDILPDFINKGIYVVSNNYDEDVPYWGSMSVSVSGGKLTANTGSGKMCTTADCWTSPWLGLIPAPVCPPGYARIITINPAGWAMAQAGIPGQLVSSNLRRDLWIPDYPKNPNDYPSGSADAPEPLYFQKNTWLRANVYPHKSGSTFYGWSAIMGFMYPYLHYKDYIDDLGMATSSSSSLTPTGSTVPDSQKVVWNLFPVQRKQLEAYVTVYCYFDRTNSRYNASFVDKYDQFNNFRSTWTKNSAYTTRLNDPTLSYNDVW